MGQFKTHDTIAEFDKNGKYVRTIQGPHRSLVLENGRYVEAPKGYNQPHHANGNNMEIAHFGMYHRHRNWKKRRQNRHKKAA